MEISKIIAKKLYKESIPNWFKESIINEYGKESLEKKDFTDIKTYFDACAVLGIDHNKVGNDGDTGDEFAYKQLKIIAEAINDGWKPNWDDDSQKKWFPWFNLSSGFGFADSAYYSTRTDTHCGSRLCFESKEKSDYAAQQFINIYKQFIK